jgi:hypothetical protein
MPPHTLSELNHALDAANARIEALTAEVAALKPPAPPPPTLDGPYIAPDLKQTARLVDLVCAAYPNLKPSEEDREIFVAEVRRAFVWAGTVSRGEIGKVDTHHASSFWTALCSDSLRSHGLGDARPHALYVALIGAGDVEYHSPAGWGFGGGKNWGLAVGLGARKPTNSWLRVLESGKLRPPLEPPGFKGWRPQQRQLNLTPQIAGRVGEETSI